MNNKILVSSSVLNETATSFRNNVSKMRELLNDATNKINATNNNWSGGAAEALREKFLRAKNAFEPFCQNVEGFAKFLDESATGYMEAENKIQRAAEETISDINPS